VGPPVPFIVGCGRSGTTLLRSMLDSHPGLALPGENDLLLHELKADTPFARGEPVEVAWLAARVRESPATEASLGSYVADLPGPTTTLGEWFAHAYGAYASDHGKARYGDKTPGLVKHMPAVIAAVPDAVFIHIIRDGRDVAQALLDQPWGPESIIDAASMWRRHVTSGRRVGLSLPRDRYLELRYEDLVADPEPRLRDICAFLALDFSPTMLSFGDSAERAQAYTPFPDSHRNLDRGVTPGLRDWRVDMSFGRRLMFELQAGGTLEMCGYEVGLPQRVARSLEFRARRLRRAARRRR
jgi:hypothetical protein